MCSHQVVSVYFDIILPPSLSPSFPSSVSLPLCLPPSLFVQIVALSLDLLCHDPNYDYGADDDEEGMEVDEPDEEDL